MYVLFALGGATFALVVWWITGLEDRYALAVVGGIVLIAAAMVSARRIDDFLIYLFIANIPFAAFEKWLFVQKVAVTAKGLTLGVSELLLLIAYGVWLHRICVARSEPIPSFTRLDGCMALLLVSQAVSSFGAPNKALAVFDIVYNLRHFLIYFYLSRRVERRHLKWIVALVLAAVLLQSGLGFYERLTGNVGIGLSKGNVESEDFGRQYQVPGTEEFRAAGTTNDSHTLALYLVMLLPVPFALMFLPGIKVLWRTVLAAVFVTGVGGLIVTFSRSGWLSFGIAMTFAVIYVAVAWKRRVVVPAMLGLLLLVSLAFPQGYSYVVNRVVDAPPEILEARYDTYWTALDIWRHNPFFGYGPGNYIEALADPGVRAQTYKGDWDVDIPVHNAFLWVAAETGLFGTLFFFSMIVLGMIRCVRFLDNEDPLVKGLSLAIVTGIAGYLLDGLTDPMFREASPYAQLWTYLGLVMAFGRFVPVPNALDAPGNGAPAP